MIGTLTAMQWYIYDNVKRYFGLEASGGIKQQKTSEEDTAEDILGEE